MKAASIIAVTMLAFSQSALADAVYYCITKTDFHVKAGQTVSYEPVIFKIKVNEASVKIDDNKGHYHPKAEFAIFERQNDKSWKAFGYGQAHQLAFEYPNLFHTHTSGSTASVTHSVCDAF